MKKISISKILISIVALFTSFACYAFDWNHTHIYNPNWPPHAKFHNAQTMMLGTILGLLALWFLWFQKGGKLNTLRLSILLASLYWFAQLGALLFPGTALVDPEFVNNGPPAAQLIVCIIVFAILSLSYLSEVKRMQHYSA